jgi:hypothetical protein
MSKIELNEISGLNDGPVYFDTGISGDGNYLSFDPQLLTLTPNPSSTQVSISTSISITFDQDIIFLSAPGTIELRSDSKTGSVIESFITGSSSGLSISGDTLTINPTNNLPHGKSIHVILPSVGIGNTYGSKFLGNSNYKFTTEYEQLNYTGGTHEFTRVDPGSPTNYYKYHVFLGTGTLEVNAPSYSNPSFYMMVVGGGGSGGPGYSPTYAGGGGGGGGGVLSGESTIFANITPGTHTITIGSGGARVPGPQPPQNYAVTGGDTTIANFVTAKGGGGGGGYGPTPGNNGQVGASGGGGRGGPHPRQPQYPTSGFVAYQQGGGFPGQGYSGGSGGAGYTPTYSHFYVGGGGGGAGGEGGHAIRPGFSAPQWPSYPNSPVWNATGGNGGSGKQVPAFSSSILSGNVPLMPTDVLAEIGSLSRYGGGGGGGAPSTVPFCRAGQGGNGGGGHGAFVRPGQYNPSPFTTETGSNYNAQDGFTYLGGGGGGGISPQPSTYNSGQGGSGVVMIRYSIPSTLHT